MLGRERAPAKVHALALSAALAASSLSGAAAAAEDRFALGMFHFNVQYVAGGMVGYYSTPNPIIDQDAEQVEDRIVTESLAPVLELYEKHPTWGVDIEMQGYLLDVLAARHPATLDLLRKLGKSGQIEILSFHYSDQLFIAHPREDWSRSQELTAATFAKHDVPLGTSVFCQEGQSGARMAPEMKARGYQTMIWPKNLWIYQHGDFDPDPLYQFGEVSLVVGARGVDRVIGEHHVQTAWTFFDDGELLATGDKNPYFPDVFYRDQAALDAYEEGLSELEAAGYRISTVRAYADFVKGIYQPKPTPPLLDGTWQPNSTDGVHRWLGGGGLWGVDERDNDVRTLASIAHRELLAAETIAASAGIDAAAAIADAWRLVALGEVSDASGINPFRGEAEYGIAHMTEALRIAREVIRAARAELGGGVAAGPVSIDPASSAVKAGAAAELRGEPVDPPLSLVINGDDRPVTERWERVREDLFRVEIAFGVGESRYLSVRFPGVASDPIVTTAALADDAPVSFDRAAFGFEHFYLPLPVGMVGLGGGAMVVQDQAYVHLAAEVFRESGDVVFEDQTQTAGETVSWVFYVLAGAPEDAVALASAINGKREVTR